MHRISDFKMTGISRRNFAMFRSLCGENTLKNVVIVTNMWGEVEESVGARRETELKTDELLFKPVLDRSARMMRHTNTIESAQLIVSSLIGNRPDQLQIQTEVVDEHKDLNQTAAGSFLDSEAVEKARREHEEELQRQREEAERIQREREEQLVREREHARREAEAAEARAREAHERFLAQQEEERRQHEVRMQEMRRKVEAEAEARRQEDARIRHLEEENQRRAHEAEEERRRHERAMAEIRGRSVLTSSAKVLRLGVAKTEPWRAVMIVKVCHTLLSTWHYQPHDDASLVSSRSDTLRRTLS